VGGDKMTPTFFPLNEDFLRAIKNLDSQRDPNWEIIRNHISEISKAQTEIFLNSFPEPTDASYSVRSHVMQGVTMALHVISNVFTHVNELINEWREQDEIDKALQEKMEMERSSGENY
jgi:hypothetical protein